MRARDGVPACELVMGTPANLEALPRSAPSDATPADVVIAVDGPWRRGARRRRARARRAARDAAAGAAARRAALARRAAELAGANVALISVPGEYAVLEAHRALTAACTCSCSPTT